MQKRTLSSHADITHIVFWQRKGALISIATPTRLLILQALHQCRHIYVPRHDFIAGTANKLADDASRITHLSDSQFLLYFNVKYLQRLPWKLWTPPLQLQ